MKTILEVKNGYGKATDERGNTFTVLKSEGLWNLSRKLKNENCSYFVKENVKRLRTLQKFVDNHNYDIEIKEIEY